MTNPTIRDKFADCYEGTAVLEEADQAWKDTLMRRLSVCCLIDTKGSAEAAYKVPSGNKKWVTEKKKYFGATALHPRFAFRDPALDGRTGSVRSRPDHSRLYHEYSEQDPWNVEGKELVRDLRFEPLSIDQPTGIAARVFSTYRLLVGMAKLCGDISFTEQVLSTLRQETLELKEAQSAEPDGLVLRAIVEIIFADGAP